VVKRSIGCNKRQLGWPFSFLIKPAFNFSDYGRPIITYGIDYSGKIVSEKTTQAGMEQPIVQWTPSIGECQPLNECKSNFAI
jgi:hypothetical protein